MSETLPSPSDSSPPTPATPPLQGLAGTVPIEAKPLTFKDLIRLDLGFIPVILTLIAIVIYFQIATDGVFLDPRNLSNLLLQIVRIGVLAVAAVMVLLLGEIDLSLAAVSSACAAIMAVLSERLAWPPVLAIGVGILSGTLMGLLNGFFIAILRVPSFIVTLAGSIAYAGLVLLVLAPQTTLIIRAETIRVLGGSGIFLDPIYGIGLPVVAVGLYAAALIGNHLSRDSLGLKTRSRLELTLQLASLIVVVGSLLYLLAQYQGVPLSFAIMMAIIILFWLITTRTSFGRHIYAVGGNAEAARRVGINVVGIRLAIFAIASTLAAVGGILAASRATAVASQIDPTLLLNAIAAAVIGGVSLFGGRGSVWAVILGSLVIGSLENGLTLLNQDQGVKNLVQGLVLLMAVTLDAVVRRANMVKGR
ncbi:MAG: inner-membrane translocator [Cyanobacteriota bacterium]|nr:inner-membrane translocator [Cyanobacteriota bacterium]